MSLPGSSHCSSSLTCGPSPLPSRHTGQGDFHHPALPAEFASEVYETSPLSALPNLLAWAPHRLIGDAAIAGGYGLHLLGYPLRQILHQSERRYQTSRASPSSQRSLSQPGPFAVTPAFAVVLPYSWWGPATLLAVLRSYGPGGHPPAFDAITGTYLAPRFFSSGLGGLHRLRTHPFRACCRPYPAGSATGVS